MKLHFVGSPPFEVVLRVKEDGRTIAESYVVSEIQKQDYTAKVPITLKPLSTYKVSIIRVSDRRCASTVVAEQDMATQEIKVEEVATIRRASSSDYCVGDLIHYDIKGPLGITLTTQFTSGNRRREQHAVDVSSRTFSRLATLPGKFEILSISSATCSSSAAAIDSVSIIHPLPGAKVSKGYTIVENIRGDQEAEIRFDLEGVPPFVLSFERRHGAMVESHTVSYVQCSFLYRCLSHTKFCARGPVESWRIRIRFLPQRRGLGERLISLMLIALPIISFAIVYRSLLAVCNSMFEFLS